ncbi:hypothetical protein ACP4OV_005505 [Aristida adscensionis]
MATLAPTPKSGPTTRSQLAHLLPRSAPKHPATLGFPMAAAAAAARRGISRGRLVSLAVSVALVLAACWAGLAFHIAEAAGRCLAAEGSVWADDGCRHLMAYPPAVAVVSLLLMLALCLREARAEAKVREAKLAGEGLRDAVFVRELGFAVGPETHHLREASAMAVIAIGVIYLFSFVVMILGLVVQIAGSRRLQRDKADKGGLAMVDAGAIITNVDAYPSGLSAAASSSLT